MEHVVKELPQQPVSTREEAPTTPERSIKESVVADSLAGIFGLKPGEITPKEKQKIDEIVGWVQRSNGSPEDLDLAWAVIKKRNQLGTPRMGTSTIDHMYQWYKASMDYQSAQEKLRILEMGQL